MPAQESENARILLSLLESVERDGTRSQRSLAAEFGIALGLVNAYLKRCVKKGLIKVTDAPARRYTYYLTPQGFAEKSRLTVEYLSYSFSFFRRARGDCTAVFDEARRRGWTRLVLAGVSDLAEIATICALENKMTIVAVVDADTDQTNFVGLPVFRCLAEVAESYDGAVITALQTAASTFETALNALGPERVLAPLLLGLSFKPKQKAAS